MSHHTDIVSGLLDGQLTGIRLWLARRHVSVCPLCAAEYRRQRHVRDMLHANPPAAAMSDSPEFFWSKVKAEIQRRGTERVEAPMVDEEQADQNKEDRETADAQQQQLQLQTAQAGQPAPQPGVNGQGGQDVLNRRIGSLLPSAQ